MPQGYNADGSPIGRYNLGKIYSPKPTESLTILDIAWAAGIYEGLSPRRQEKIQGLGFLRNEAKQCTNTK